MKPSFNAHVAKLTQRLASETDPVLRRNLTTVIEHLECEAGGRLDPLMATMVPEPIFHSFFGKHDAPGSSPKGGAKSRSESITFNGGKAVREMYTKLCATRRRWRELGIGLQFDPDMVLVDRHCVLTEGIMNYPYSGAELNKIGFAVDHDAYYLAVGRMVIFLPIDLESGLMKGEDVYIDPGYFDGVESRKLTLDA